MQSQSPIRPAPTLADFTVPLPKKSTVAQVVHAHVPKYLAPAAYLLRLSQLSLGTDRSFDAFRTELASLPGDYVPPDGCLLLAFIDDMASACCALRRIGPDVCEMTRLFVMPKARRNGLGRALAQAILAFARQAGYARMRLDTLVSMAPAMALCESLGFTRVEPHCDNPSPDAVVFELRL